MKKILLLFITLAFAVGCSKKEDKDNVYKVSIIVKEKLPLTGGEVFVDDAKVYLFGNISAWKDNPLSFEYEYMGNGKIKHIEDKNEISYTVVKNTITGRAEIEFSEGDYHSIVVENSKGSEYKFFKINGRKNTELDCVF